MWRKRERDSELGAVVEVCTSRLLLLMICTDLFFKARVYNELREKWPIEISCFLLRRSRDLIS